jgi:hypothetical protein
MSQEDEDEWYTRDRFDDEMGICDGCKRMVYAWHDLEYHGICLGCGREICEACSQTFRSERPYEKMHCYTCIGKKDQ